MTQITDDLILDTLEKNYSSLHLDVILLGIFALIIGVATFVLFKMDRKSKVVTLIALLSIIFPLIRYFL